MDFCVWLFFLFIHNFPFVWYFIWNPGKIAASEVEVVRVAELNLKINTPPPHRSCEVVRITHTLYVTRLECVAGFIFYLIFFFTFKTYQLFLYVS